MRAIAGFGAALLLAVMGGCATAPKVAEVQRTATVDRPFDAVWSDLVAFFATNSIPIRNIEKDSGLIVAERESRGVTYGPAFDGMADCGTPGFPWVARARTVRLNVLARPVAPDRTAVTVTSVFEELRRSDFASATVECSSTGFMERMIHDRARGLFPVQ